MEEVRYTRDHVLIRWSGGSCVLEPTPFLRAQLGAPARFVFLPVGSVLAAGAPLGRLEGPQQVCHFYAPFSLEVLRADAEQGWLEVRATAQDDQALLDAPSYAAYCRGLSA